MTPLEALDAYAEQSNRGAISRDGCAPKAFDALRAVLDIHQPEPVTAGVLSARFGVGRCAYCHLGEPLRRYQGYLNRAVSKSELHAHADPTPWCTACLAPADMDVTAASYPCPTVQAITSALEES